MRTPTRNLLAGLASASFVALTSLARADVVSATDNGFEVLERVSVVAPPKEAYLRLINIGTWWSKAHTYSGDASNMALDALPGGCFCERLKNGGGVQHMVVVYVAPNETLRLVGALGPLQALGVAGSMTITLAPAGTGTDIALAYRVGGYTGDGMKKWAEPVDGVLSEQLGRLKRMLDSGNPDAAASK